MKSSRFFATAIAVSMLQLSAVPAWAAGEHDQHHAAPAAGMTDAEVRKVDKDAKKITLKHGEIKNLDMPAMTMVFQVRDAALLDKVKAGDKVSFNAEKVPGGYAVTAIEVAK